MTDTHANAHMDPPPFSHPIDVAALPPDGAQVDIQAGEAERQALARAFGLVAIERLVAHFDLTGTARRLKVKGRVEADIVQTCVVTLEPFPARVQEAVDVTFSEDVPPEGGLPQHEDDGASQREVPDAIVDGRIDLGGLAGEFLALGLDPYPRKPGAEFSFSDEAAEQASPFSQLARLKGRPGGES